MIDFADWADGQAVIASVALIPTMVRVAQWSDRPVAMAMAAAMALHGLFGSFFFASRLLMFNALGAPRPLDWLGVHATFPEWTLALLWVVLVAATLGLVTAKFALVWIGEGRKLTRIMRACAGATVLWAAAAVVW